MPIRLRAVLFVVPLVALAFTPAQTQSPARIEITSPRQALGAAIGDDYFLATYAQLESYWTSLDRESDRVALVDIGRTEEGRTQWMAVVSAPENLAHLDRYRDIAARLARAEGLTPDAARALAQDGKTVVWIDGGLHATEVLGAQQLIELVYQLASASDAETLRILRDVIVLAVHANPDGHELVANWYMRTADPRKRSLSGVPRPYQKYVGHDNNRDFYLSSQAETRNMNRVLYREWFPQIVYNHHQAGPRGTVMFAPPFRDPFNYVFDPLIPASIDLAGAAMQARFAAEGKAGVTTRGGSTYSAWWNGGLRTTAYFHNQIGLLTETIGDPTPTAIPFVPERQLPSGDLPFPIAPQPWHFRQSIDYSLTANRAVLDFASRYRETLLYNVYQMGRNAIDRGSRDAWTASPRRVDTAKAEAGSAGLPPADAFDRLFRDPQQRDPRGYILPADQPDFLTAAKFAGALVEAGVTVLRATADFTVQARRYPAGSFVVKTAQAFRPHVLDMFEPQEHPNDVAYPGGPPVPPYDNAGWTLAFQMGVKFDRVLDAFEGPFEALSSVAPPAGDVRTAAGTAGYLVSHHQNDAFVAVNRLLRAGADVYWPADRGAGGAGGTGAMFVPATSATRAIVDRAAADLGLVFTGVPARPAGPALKLRPARIALWDRYGGASSSGWIRWLLERYEFPFEVVYPRTFDEAGLSSRFDVVILPGEAAPAGDGSRGDGPFVPDDAPEEYRRRAGAISWTRTLPRLKQFVEEGGTLILIGRAAGIAERLGIGVSDALVETRADGTRTSLSRDKHYIPGSVMRVAVDNTLPLGYGFEREVDVFFDASPAFRLDAGAAARRVAWYPNVAPLRSGWALGQRYLNGNAAAIDAPLGRGRVLVFGPEITYRAQPHGTFKFLFNGIFYPRALRQP
ncbi:MAG TPA: M14 metallopeptidase family protein [Vicinamibacterales bacterium]|nr:M14 metallopeptidase family protein [Vicinamibacterales bacterium]